MKLFISHASEDKTDFVRPLAEALRKHYEIWYDEYELTLGDNLLQRIDAGLRSCDYGVVVFSPAFFSKKWPRAELDGLFALETSARKIILPIWKDVSVEDVQRFSPILAGRVAVSADKGIETIVDEIKRAIDVSERTRQVSLLESAMGHIRGLDQSLKEQREAAVLLRTPQGVELIQKELQKVFSNIESLCSQFSESSAVIKFLVKRQGDRGLLVRTGYGLHLGLYLESLETNCAERASLKAKIYRVRTLQFGQQSEPEVIRGVGFSPTFHSGKEVVWKSEDEKVLSTEELVAELMTRLTDQYEMEAR